MDLTISLTGAEQMEQEFEAYLEKLDAAVADVMENEVFIAGRDSVMVSLAEYAYKMYTPQGKDPYVRRYDEGGLADPRNIVRAEGGGPTEEPLGYEIAIEDIAPDEDGLPVAEIVESGVGYHWKGSKIYQKQPFPRPIYGPAGELMLEKGWFEEALLRGLRSRGIE